MGRDRIARGVSPETVGTTRYLPSAPPQGPASPGLAAARRGEVSASSVLGAHAPSYTIAPPFGGSNDLSEQTLRTLMIAVALVAVLLGRRMNLRHRAHFHHQELSKILVSGLEFFRA